jgi:hypothetical protein
MRQFLESLLFALPVDICFCHLYAADRAVQRNRPFPRNTRIPLHFNKCWSATNIPTWFVNIKS